MGHYPVLIGTGTLNGRIGSENRENEKNKEPLFDHACFFNPDLFRLEDFKEI
jgi:hypothetical protein